MSKLYILSGPDKGRVFDLNGETILVGRGPENDIRLTDPSVSRRHLKVSKREGRYFIEDLASTNGTYLNRSLIGSGKSVPVEEGIPIGIGNLILCLGKKCTDELFPGEQLDLPGGTNVTQAIDRPLSPFRNLGFIYKVCGAFMESLDLHETLERILNYIFEILVRIDRASVILIDRTSGEISQVHSKTKEKKTDAEKTYSLTVVNKVIREGKPIVIPNISEEEQKISSRSMEFMRVKSVICVPLLREARILGVLYVDSVKMLYGFRREDLSLLTALSSLAAVAVENAMVYSDMERIVESRTKDLLVTQERLRESEALFKAIFNNMTSGVGVYKAANSGDDFVLLSLNKAYRRIEKIPEHKKMQGLWVFDAFPAYRGYNIIEVFKRVWKTGIPEQSSLTLMDGEEIKGWREYYVYRLPTGEIVAIFDDVTEQKKAEKEQRILQDQLLFSQKMESIGALAGGIAHNFRNILQAISGNVEYVEMIKQGEAEIENVAKAIYDSVEKGVDLINNLLQFSQRDKAGTMVELDLAVVIERTYEIISRVFDRRIDIRLNIERDLVVEGNASLLSQVFMNLFNNARDAMPEGGKLLIKAKKEGDKVVATIADTGVGMSEETKVKIFDPFFTLKEVGKGTGLGLSTVLGIIKQHNGSISVHSKVGKGSMFKISLPCIREEEVQEPELS